MKGIGFKLFIILILFVGVGCRKKHVQVEPQAVGHYSVQSIDSLLEIFESNKLHDTKPSDVLFQTFIRNFPNAKDIDWEVSGYIYRVEFEVDDRDYKAFYDHSANLLSYSCELNEEELPAVVKNSSVAVYPDYNFDDIMKIVKGRSIFYQLKIEKNDIEKILILKDNGVILPDFVMSIPE